MNVTDLPIQGALLIHEEAHRDERGFFSRLFCADRFRARGMVAGFPQVSVSHNSRPRTFRGMHWQAAPHAETKLVRCMAGRIHDIILDLRPDSPSRHRWVGLDLDARSGRMLYIPEGCAHGFLTLEPATEVLYFISHPYVPDAARGVRWDDPAFGIRLPEPVEVISQRDRDFPLWTEPS